MSEDRQWIDPALDGSGGGYGKFKGMTIREMSGVFKQIGAEANMRSVSAILRICHEQLEGRSHLGVASLATKIIGVVTMLLVAGMFFVSEHLRPILIKGTGAAAVLFAGFLSGSLANRRMAKSSIAQERAIGEMAIDVLEQLVDTPGFKAKELDSLQKLTLKKLMKISRTDSEKLRAVFEL